MKSILLSIFLCLPFLTVAQDDAVGMKIQQLSRQLADGIKARGKTRVGVTDLTDLQNNPTELGAYLAIELQSNLVGNGMRVVNRQRLEQLLVENKLTAQGILDPENALKLKRAAGMEVVVIGTLTPFEKNVVINVLALDLEGAEAIASAKTTIPRTQDVDALLRNFSRQPVTVETQPGAVVKSAANENAEKMMDKAECEVSGVNYGNFRFENRFTKPILLYKINTFGDVEQNILISPGAVGDLSRIYISSYPAYETTFFFKTVTQPAEEGFLKLTVSKCKSKFVSLTPANLHLAKSKEN